MHRSLSGVKALYWYIRNSYAFKRKLETALEFGLQTETFKAYLNG